MGKIIDLTNIKFGRLEVIEFAGINKHHQATWLCKCDCGNEKIIRGNSLRRGITKSCGCIRTEYPGKNVRENLVGKTFGLLHVLAIDNKSKNSHTHYLCKCECGNIVSVNSCNLKSGATKSCGCLQKKILGEKSRKDISGNKYGLLKAIKPIGRTNKRNVIWECVCDCGNVTYATVTDLNRGNKKSCGCLKSILESKTESYLINWNIKHKWHHSPPDLFTSNGRLCEFDFLILYECNSFAYIECQGEQHYKDYSSFGKLQREETDELKREYCKRKGIPLFEIRYDEDIEVKLKEILDTLHVNPVPDVAQSAA